MKLTASQLKKIIAEETKRVLRETDGVLNPEMGPGGTGQQRSIRKIEVDESDPPSNCVVYIGDELVAELSPLEVDQLIKGLQPFKTGLG
jgi:hypothetical protein